MRWWKEWTFPRYLDRRSLSPLRHPEVLLIRNRVWQRAGFTWTGKERDGRESCVKDRCRKEKNLITTPSESQRATQVCLTLMSVSSTPVLSAYSITLGWAENSHHRHDDLALKYRLWSSSRTVCILMGHSVTLHLVWLLTDNTSICKRNQQTAFPLNKKPLYPLPTVHSFATPLSLTTRTSPKTWGLTAHSGNDGISTTVCQLEIKNSGTLLRSDAYLMLMQVATSLVLTTCNRWGSFLSLNLQTPHRWEDRTPTQSNNTHTHTHTLKCLPYLWGNF